MSHTAIEYFQEKQHVIPAHIFLAKASHMAGRDELQEREEVQVHCVPGLRRGDSQRTALPDNEKQRKGSKEVNLTTD